MSFDICFVCTGNICRSPAAEGIMQAKLFRSGLSDRINVTSAGIEGYHIGEAPDPRTIRSAALRGYDLAYLRARKIKASDLDRYHRVFALDRGHLSALKNMGASNASRFLLLTAYSKQYRNLDVPDPYYGDHAAFEHVLDMIEESADCLIDRLSQEGL